MIQPRFIAPRFIAVVFPYFCRQDLCTWSILQLVLWAINKTHNQKTKQVANLCSTCIVLDSAFYMLNSLDFAVPNLIKIPRKLICLYPSIVVFMLGDFLGKILITTLFDL